MYKIKAILPFYIQISVDLKWISWALHPNRTRSQNTDLTIFLLTMAKSAKSMLIRAHVLNQQTHPLEKKV